MGRPAPVPRALLYVLFWGAALRALNLGAWSLWLDEGVVWSWVTRPTWGGTIFAEANHPPGWWIVTRAWASVFGDSEAALRAPAAILGALAPFLAWRLALRLLRPTPGLERLGFSSVEEGTARRTALWLAAIVGLGSYFIEYSQEARMYPALLVEALGLSLLYLRWLDRGERWVLVAYGVLATATLYTQYFGIWPIAAHAAHALWLAWSKPDAPKPAPFLVAVTCAGLAFVPWFAFFVTHYQGMAKPTANPLLQLPYITWRIGAGPALFPVDRATIAEGPAAALRASPALAAFTIAAWFLPMALGVRALARRLGAFTFAAFSLGVPLLVLLAISPVLPLFHERYLSFLAPWAGLLVALGIATAPGWLRVVLGAGVAALLLAGTTVYHFSDPNLEPTGARGTLDGGPAPQAFVPRPDPTLEWLTGGHVYGREPWREAHAFVAKHAEDGDLVCLHPHYLYLVWDYYDRGRLDQVRLSMDPWTVEEILEAHGPALRDRRRVFLLLSHETTPDPDHYVRVLGRVLGRVWLSEGAGGIRIVGPVLFDLSWGVRVAVFTRS